MHRTLAILAMTAFAALPAIAEEFVKVSDEAAFLSLLDGRELRLGVVGLSIAVNPDGSIVGTAAGFPITGNWTWQDGFFCRDLDWSGTVIPYNCQLVEARGTEVMRFTVDQGAGDAAEFNLR